ncbi:branched-chain amino acid transport system substrate-binding protein [Paucibacter oligotrophus]|uniref:Branched-chain amino acid transport system substrate-binding protein n=1 Tax=Roseateles oligotrophus TaxID=1769250 RepID=A0A840LLQ1_9BURK|nr:ABC transporter substrate-binding protein [Roseateles oligotrophus]MBB4846237.1 branched-chain amino acid transport system substrate-binding protein [Roseateles oligotrophus]
MSIHSSLTKTVRHGLRLHVLATCIALAAGAQAQNIRIGVLATLDGPLALLGQDSMRGAELAVDEFNGQIGTRKIELVKESSNAKPDVAVAKAKKLIEQDKVDFMIGPLSGSEGLAVKEYAKTVPAKTFINGTSAAQELTLRDPAPNMFRFTGDGAQWQAGLGTYVYDVKKYKRVVLVSEDYSFPYSQVAGFAAEFCAKGGKIVEKFWVPLGTKDFSSVIAKIPSGIDAIYIIVSGADAVNFLTQYQQSGGKLPLIGGTPTVDRNVLSTKGGFRKTAIGVVTAGPLSEGNDDPQWVSLVKAYQKKFPDGLGSPSFGALTYYVNMKAALTALATVKGDMNDDQKQFRAALQATVVDTPMGRVSLDANRQGIVDNFISEVAENADGALHLKLVARAKGINQTLGVPRDVFLARGPASRDNPSCP